METCRGEESPKYTERFVAFLDILGFSGKVRESANLKGRVNLERLLEALKHPNPAGPDQIVIARIGDISNSDHRLSYFSDSVVISTDPTESGLFHLVNHVERIGWHLLELGFLCRGGVTRGLLYHSNNTVVGPALLEAYEFEKSMAKTPRIIVNDETAEAALKYSAPVGELFRSLLYRDQDGSHTVHILRRMNYYADDAIAGKPLPERLTNIQQGLARQISDLGRAKKDKERKYVEAFKQCFDSMLKPIDEMRKPLSPR